ncbi:MAG: hypothetical protein P8M12_07270 [Flavobacteriales bacterium]|nr:hypothetical protein [Flavobacteriales bacterium]
MEKNLPFNLPIADKAYNDYVIPFLAKLDDGNVFKNFITTILKISMYGFLIYGIYLSISGLFGDRGFFSSIDRYDGWQGIGAYVGGPIGALLSIVVSWLGYSLLKKRIEQLYAEPYDSLLNYLYKSLFPKLIIITGELAFLLVMSAGVFQLLATLLGTVIYRPLANLIPMLIEPLNGLPGMRGITRGMSYYNDAIGNYEYFFNSLSQAIMLIIMSFIILMFYYILVEIYKYAIKLIVNIIKFLPKFAIPLAIRNRTEN